MCIRDRVQREGEVVVACGPRMPSLVFYSQRPIAFFDTVDAATSALLQMERFRAIKRSFYPFICTPYLPQVVVDLYGSKTRFTSSGWSGLRRQRVSARMTEWPKRVTDYRRGSVGHFWALVQAGARRGKHHLRSALVVVPTWLREELGVTMRQVGLHAAVINKP
eukprot:1477234-Pyramimonas_sp.AAC.1